MSKTGLVDQLAYEGYDRTTAESAVVFAEKHAEIDWDLMAAVSAMSYLEQSSFSRSGLADQLEYEGYTPSQVRFALNAAY
jgi:predicted TPR repeat methyltransferase